jgi:hypothetical protein
MCTAANHAGVTMVLQSHPTGCIDLSVRGEIRLRHTSWCKSLLVLSSSLNRALGCYSAVDIT